MEDELLFVDEVAKLLRRSASSVRVMITEGSAPKNAKIGGRIVFRRSDVDAFIANLFKEAS